METQELEEGTGLQERTVRVHAGWQVRTRAPGGFGN